MNFPISTALRTSVSALLVLILVTAFASFAHAGKKGSTAKLVAATAKGDIAAVTSQLDKGGDANARDKDGSTLLIIAAAEGYRDVVELLISRDADVNARADDGFSALLYAAQQGHVGIVESLLEAGANVNATDNLGVTALMQAAQRGHLEVAELLIARGADLNAKPRLQDRSMAALLDLTALMWAIRHGHADVATALLVAGADPNVRGLGDSGATALHLAIRKKSVEESDVELVEALLRAGADVDAPFTDLQVSMTVTPLTIAKALEHEEIAKLLEAAEAQTPKTGAALLKAIERGDDKKTKRLLEGGTDPNATDDSGRTALMYAAVNGQTDLIGVLIDRGARINVSSKAGETALTLAAHFGDPEGVKLLLENGADVSVKDANEWTALKYAEARLQFAPAERPERNSRGLLTFAAKADLETTIEMLEGAGAKND